MGQRSLNSWSSCTHILNTGIPSKIHRMLQVFQFSKTVYLMTVPICLLAEKSDVMGSLPAVGHSTGGGIGSERCTSSTEVCESWGLVLRVGMAISFGQGLPELPTSLHLPTHIGEVHFWACDWPAWFLCAGTGQFLPHFVHFQCFSFLWKSLPTCLLHCTYRGSF